MSNSSAPRLVAARSGHKSAGRKGPGSRIGRGLRNVIAAGAALQRIREHILILFLPEFRLCQYKTMRPAILAAQIFDSFFP